ncbi:cytochrome P450 4C1-like [Schistocerca gregaria]|uniref:cytochrome P450 4C1-like n=1 Tax=Schistocerca gregaria TaxID=7010 RepID=UPI00211EC88B|nr:cytochrome P450 4C1-like [Schistocerca gregaria]
MDLLTAVLTLVLILVPLTMFVQKRRKRAEYCKLIDRLPGPAAYPLIGTAWEMLFAERRDIFRMADERGRKYWPLFRTWMGPLAEIHVIKPQHVEIIMSSTDHIEKSLVYRFLHPWLGQGLLTSKGSKWHSHRKMITPTFHFKILETFFEVFEDKSQLLVKKLKDEANGQVFNIHPYVTRCALDVICETAMGTPVNAQEETDSAYVSAVYAMSETTLQRIVRPWLHPDFIYKRTKYGKIYYESLNVLHGFTEKVIRERKASRLNNNKDLNPKDDEEEVFGKKKRVAFLDLLLEASDGGKNLTDLEIREEVDTFMFEGHDTTAASMSWILYLLGLHQDVQEKVAEELCDIFQGSDRPTTMQDIQAMKYLERVIKEGLRLYPSVPFIGRILRKETKIDGYTIPPDTLVNIHIYHTHRDPEQWPNPERFDPDNFLPERIQGRHPFAYVPFSGGPRNCIGQKFALLEEKVVLSNIIRKFKIESVEDREKMTLIGELILRPENGVLVKMKSR